MRKIIALVLSMVVLFTALYDVHSQDNVDAVFDNEITLLNALQITNVDGLDNLAHTLSRERFAVMCAKMFNINESENINIRYFTDTDKDSYGTGCINSLVQLRVINVGEDRKFRPEDEITFAEACKMLVCSTGYEEYAENLGKYPYGYISAASKLKIAQSMDADYKITFADALKMIYNTLQLSVCDVTSISKNGNEYSSKSGKTLLSYYRNIYFANGTVNAVCGESTVKDLLCEDDEIIIDGVKYTVNAKDYLGNKLGSYVKFFYEESKDGKKRLVCIVDEGRSKEDIRISIDDFLEYNNGVLKYHQSESKVLKKTVKNPVFVYNGEVIDTDIKKTFEELNKGNIVIKDSDNDGTYDLVLIYDYQNFYLDSIDNREQILYNKLSTPAFLDYKKYKIVHIYDENLNRIKYENLTTGDVLSVGDTRNKSVLTLIVSKKEEVGELKSINNDDNLLLFVNDNEYVADKTYLKAAGNNIYVGKEYTFKFDFLGKVAYVDEKTLDLDDMKYAYVLKGIYENSLDERVRLMVYTEDNKIEKLLCSETIKMDGERCKNAEQIIKSFYETNDDRIMCDSAKRVCYIPRQIIRYSLNDYGEISAIDTLKMNEKYENNTNSLSAIYGDSFQQHWNRAYRFGTLTSTTQDTKVFAIPYDDRFDIYDDSLIFVGSAASIIVDDTVYTSNAYTTNAYSTSASVVLWKYKYTEIESPKVAMMVSSVKTGLNSKNEIVNIACGYTEKGYAEYEMPNDINMDCVKEGNIILISTGINKTVISGKNYGSENDIDCIYDYDTYKKNVPTNWPGNTDEVSYYTKSQYDFDRGYRATNQWSFGFANSKRWNTVWFGYKRGDVRDEMYDLSKSVSVIVFDENARKDPKVYMGDINDVLTYEQVGDDCSSVILQTRTGRAFVLYVYK